MFMRILQKRMEKVLDEDQPREKVIIIIIIITIAIIIIIIIMSVFLERFSMWNMLNCAEQVQIQK